VLAVIGPEPVWRFTGADVRELDLRVEAVKSQHTLATIPYHEKGASWGLAVCPNRKLLAVCAGGAVENDEQRPFGGVEMWDLETGASTFQHKSDEVDIHEIAFSHDGKRFAIGGGYALYGELLRDFKHIYGAYQDGAATIYDATTGTVLHALPRREGVDGNSHRVVESLAFSPDDRFLVTGEMAGTITWWDASTGKEIRSADITRPWGGRVLSLAYAKTGRYVFAAVGSYNRGGRWGELRVIDDQTGEVVDVLIERDAVNKRYEYVVERLALSNDGKQLAAATTDGAIRLWTIDADER
jgi:WD40 repeat protein